MILVNGKYMFVSNLQAGKDGKRYGKTNSGYDREKFWQQRTADLRRISERTWNQML